MQQEEVEEKKEEERLRLDKESGRSKKAVSVLLCVAGRGVADFPRGAVCLLSVHEFGRT